MEGYYHFFRPTVSDVRRIMRYFRTVWNFDVNFFEGPVFGSRAHGVSSCLNNVISDKQVRGLHAESALGCAQFP